MNKLNVIIGNNTFGVLEETIKALGSLYHDLSKENIIIVPDRLSLLLEQKIFEILGIDVYFNISVMGISKFAAKVLHENGLNTMECTAIQAKLLTLRAIQNVKANFKCFSKHYTLGLVDEIYAKIEQIKSSNANIDDLVDNNASIGTKLKFQDLKLIYNEYERLRGQRLDSGALLTLFNQVAVDSESLRHTNIFFVGFDSMTRQGIQVISNVVKNALSVYVGVVAPYDQPNENIYDKSFLSLIINLCKEEKFESDMKWLDLHIKNQDADIIFRNVFSRKQKYENNNYVSVYKATTVGDEIDFLTKSINFNLKTQDLKFNQIAVCAPKEFQEMIKSKLNSLGINCYMDAGISLASLEPVKYLISILKYLGEPNDKNLLKQIISNDLCELENGQKEDLLNLLTQYSTVKSAKNLIRNDDVKNYLNNLDIRVNKSDKSENYFNLIKNIIINQKIFEKNEKICNLFKEFGEIALQKIYVQVQERLEKTFEQISQILSECEFEYSMFLEILEKAILELEISSVPATVNEVFIGDSKSFFGNVNYIYIMSANDGVFPEVLTDCGLISDKEISSESIKAMLEPTTKIINKRNKFKALEVITSASKKCYLIYHNISSDNRASQPSDFVTEIVSVLGGKEVDVSKLLINDSRADINKICFNNQDSYSANLNLRNGLDDKTASIVTGALLKINKLYFRPIVVQKKVDFAKLFFPKARASISIIEKYNACPKASFLANALKLKEQKKDRVEPNDIGLFIHDVGEHFVNENNLMLGQLTKRQVDELTESICEKIIRNEKYYSIAMEENEFIYRLIKKECKRFCNFINYEQTISDFKPAYTEKYFGENSSFKPITLNINGREYTITGIVDRIDFSDEHFRIIDYKSGNTTNAKGKDYLYYGTKIQLFIYAEAIRQNVNKKLFGAFYLPIKNTFAGQGESDYHFSGFFTSDVSIVKKCDKTLNTDNRKSKLLKCNLNVPNRDGEVLLAKRENILTDEELQAFCDYAIEVLKRSVEDIADGFIGTSPIMSKCSLCEFSDICEFSGDKKVEREESFKVTKNSFLEIKNGK